MGSPPRIEGPSICRHRGPTTAMYVDGSGLSSLSDHFRLDSSESVFCFCFWGHGACSIYKRPPSRSIACVVNM